MQAASTGKEASRPAPVRSFRAHQSLLRRLYAVRFGVFSVATAGIAVVGGAAAWEIGDAVLLALTVAACVANAVLMLVIARARIREATTEAELDRHERNYLLWTCAGTGCIGMMFTRSLLVSADPLVHVTLVALALATVSTCLRNYFSPRLVQAQISLLLGPPSAAMLFQDHAVYWALAVGGLLLGYVVSRIAEGLYWQALDSLRKDENLKEQNVRFEAALSNMAQGLSMFDGESRLVVCNRQYLDMYGFSPDVVRPGIMFEDMLRHSLEVGNHRGVPIEELVARFGRDIELGSATSLENDLGNGRTVAVFHNPLECGGWVATHEDITERKTAAERISYLARHDPLTGLPNRVQFSETFELWLGDAAGGTLALFCLDLDRFKTVNDTLGHAAGDALLKAIAVRIASCIGDGDFVARLGGDEFAILQRHPDQPEAATTLASRVRESLTRPFDLDGRQVTVGVSIGIAVADGDADPEAGNRLIRNADLALYRAKAEGRSQFRFFAAEMDDWVHRRRHLELDLRRALANGELELLYQPVFDAATRALSGAEALLRWHHPIRGTISPAEFVPIAEEIGIISSIGAWVLRTACREASSWPEQIALAVNLSPAQIGAPELVGTLTEALAASQLSPRRIELEITENVLLGDSEQVLAKLHAIRSLGVRIVMDDFGTGYSSLSYLRAFPFDKIKIDRSFINDLSADEDSLAIIRAVRDLGRSFNMSVTAEGVETEEQLAQLQREGCDEVQGYLLGEPMPPNELRLLFEAGSGRAAA